MRKQLIALSVVTLLVAPMLVTAATMWSGDRYTLSQDQTREGNLYTVSENALIAGAVRGDAVILGKGAIVTGEVSSDVLMAAQLAQISGVVAGDARLAAGETLIAGSIGGDLALLSGKTYIASGATVGGDLLAVGGDFTLDGSVAGKGRISGGEVFINGPVQGSLSVDAARLTLGEHAIIGGDLTFRGPHAPIIAPGAVIHGQTIYTADDFGSKRFGKFASGLGVVGATLVLLMNLVVALALFGLFKRHSTILTHSALSSFWPNVGRGVAFFILLFVVSIALVAVIVALPIGIFGLLTFFKVIIVGSALSGIVFGTWAARVVFKKTDHQPTAVTVIWGTIALSLITMIPVFGTITSMLFFFVSVGALAHMAHERFWKTR